MTICNGLGVAERPSKIHGAAEPADTSQIGPVLKARGGSKAGRQSAGSSLRRLRSKFSRIGPEPNGLCRIADIGRESEGSVLFGEQPARCAIRP